MLWGFLTLAWILSCQPVSPDNGDGRPSGEDPAPTEKPAASETGTGETDGYRLVWADYFNDGALDPSKWTIEVNGDGGGNAELQYYRAENVSVGKEPSSGSGCLILTARKESYLGKSFTSGRLNSGGKYAFTYGKIESRILLPKTANGLWPAFWMLGANFGEVGWPRCGEIDILEMGNSTGIKAGTQEKYFNGACHWGYYQGNPAWYPSYARSTTHAYSLQDGQFHLFTLVWDEQQVRMYVDWDQHPDADPYYSMSITDKSTDYAVGHYFHHDFFIVYDLAIGGYFTGILQPSGISALENEASMYVDFVKVYQK